MDIKIFQVEGVINRPGYFMPFTKEFRALKKEDVIETVYADLGSQQKAKRFQIRISSIKEISREAVTNPVIRELNEE
jgi:ribosomal protein L20A (L18A)